ncbi:spore germination protein [Paenibacillus anaericanus]|uniref:Ger(x)C family spore germination protein n=1 Tax=Paenibacillus anaericanus TaxID=170367 RepID=UPI002781CD9B|nr:Ger(x)C family spore germination protein [Paenibacillus anaericanus]MDQ0086867.1 spore germination protein [Paenibacillus anaericanus]
MRGLRLCAILVLLGVLSACQSTSILERQSIMVALAYDAKEDKTFQVTGTFIEAEPEAKESSHTISVEAETSKGARRKMNQMLPYTVAVGQTRVILLDRDMFRYKMLNEIEVLSRDPFYGDMINIAIVEGSPGELLKYKYEEYTNIATSLNSLLEHNTKMNWVPSMTLHDFTRSRGINRIDLAIPLIKREEEEVILSSLALIHRDQIVGEATPNEGFFLKTLKGTDTPYLYELNIKKKDMQESGMDRYLLQDSDTVKVVFNVTKSKGKIKLVDKEDLKFNAVVDIDIDIQEVSQRYNFTEPGAINALENQLMIELTKHLQQFLDKLRKVNSDCVGFGEIYRSRVGNSEVVEEKWGDMFPQSSLNGEVTIKVIRTGIIE